MPKCRKCRKRDELQEVIKAVEGKLVNAETGLKMLVNILIEHIEREGDYS